MARKIKRVRPGTYRIVAGSVQGRYAVQKFGYSADDGKFKWRFITEKPSEVEAEAFIASSIMALSQYRATAKALADWQRSYRPRVCPPYATGGSR